jgi:hypothetical protein
LGYDKSDCENNVTHGVPKNLKSQAKEFYQLDAQKKINSKDTRQMDKILSPAIPVDQTYTPSSTSANLVAIELVD